MSTHTTSNEGQLRGALMEFAVIAGDVANVCDHAEHNERFSYEVVELAAVRLRALATELATHFGRATIDLYSARLGVIERRNVAFCGSGFDGEAAALSAGSWRELQLVQIAHDRYYHPDVIGLAKNDQLRHCALHLAKLAGATANVLAGQVDVDDFISRRVPDALLFGVKLATLAGQRLPDTTLPGRSRAD